MDINKKIKNHLPFIEMLAGRYAHNTFRDRTRKGDLVNDAIVALIVKKDKYNPSKATFEAWISLIMRNVVVDHLRRPNKVVFDSLLAVDLLQQQSESDDLSSFSQIERTQEVKVLLEEIDTLSDLQRRTLIKLVFLEESGEEIAKEEGINRTTVFTRVEKAKHKLREKLEKRGIRKP